MGRGCSLCPPTGNRDVDSCEGGTRPGLLWFRGGETARLGLYDRIVGGQQQGSLDQGRDERKAFLFAHRAILLQADLGHVTVGVCGEHPWRRPALRWRGICQEDHVLAGAVLRSVMRAGAVLGVVAKCALQVKRAHDLVTPPLEHSRDCPDSSLGESGKGHCFSHFRPTFCAFHQSWTNRRPDSTWRKRPCQYLIPV